MFSLFLNAVKYAFGYEKSTESNDIDGIVTQIENASIEDSTSTLQDLEEIEGCFYQVGTVTEVREDYILIDDTHVCERIHVMIEKFDVGDKVNYLAFRRTANGLCRISRVVSLVHPSDIWQDDDNLTKSKHKSRMISRSVVASVVRREGRDVYLEPNNLRVNLDATQAEFVPFVGDWLKLESLVEVNEYSEDLSGQVLEIERFQPLRSKLIVGTVTSYTPATGQGIIDKSIVFSKISCEAGYLPCIGDKVVVDAIESDQGIYSWRSLSVVPLQQVPQESPPQVESSPYPATLGDKLLENKRDVIITDNLHFDLDVDEEKELVVEVQNNGKVLHTIMTGYFVSKKAQSQLSLVWPTTTALTPLKPMEAVSYIFKCRAKFVGSSDELFVFSFKGFKIGRIFHIHVKPKRTSNLLVNSGYRRNQHSYLQQDLQDNGNYVPGVRPCKPPAFVTVRNGVFRVPQRFWDAVLQPLNEGRSEMELEMAVGDAIPCLQRGLNFESYKERFHALLYLEEIGVSLDMRQYDMESVVMRHCGEFLSMDVPGLAERRPSLIIGDKAIVSFKWDSSGGNAKYEGYIHRVKCSEVWLKFNPQFHQEYHHEDCRVTFKCSQSAMRRYHTAVNLAVTHLGPEFLFPRSVQEKEPQLDLEEDDSADERPLVVRVPSEHRRNESISSTCSSVISNSDTSSDSINPKSSSRKSVVERLFNAKPTSRTPTTSLEKKVSPVSKDAGTETKDTRGPDSDQPPVEVTDEAKVVLDSCVSRLKRRKLVWFDKKLNYYQKEAVRNILKGLARPLPYVIFGPPGTGKTVTLCEAILQILVTVPESRLLVATPSNSSANLIVERLLDSGVLKPGDLVRLLAHHCLDDDSVPERLLPYCATADLAAERTRPKYEHSGEGVQLNCTSSVLGRHRITVGTCVSLGILYNIGFPRGHFSHVLVDEAGQATEPEIMIPLNFIHSSHGQVVLAGDPLQLGPVVQSKLAQHFGYAESFLTRLLHQFPYQRDPEGFETGYDPRLVTKLLFNYRSLPEILELPNSLFYDSELIPQVSPKASAEAKVLKLLAEELPKREGRLPPAVVFHGVNGTNCQEPDNPSWYNPEEATQVYLYLLGLYKCGLTADDIGIITPYKKQVHQIQDLLQEVDAATPKVSSVEGFQGQERKVIILSTVRSASSLVSEDIKRSLGFIASPQRLNVAITRAKALLVIIGNPQLLSRDPYWRSVLMYCIENGGYTGCSFLPSYVNTLSTATDDDEDKEEETQEVIQ